MYREKIYENKKIIILVFCIIFAASFGNISWFIFICNNHDYNFCKLDFILLILQPNYMGTFLSIFAAYLSMHMAKYDFNTNLILRYKNRKTLWLRQSLHILINNFIIMCSIVVFNFIIGIVNQRVTYNWNAQDSLFAHRTHGIIVYDRQLPIIVSVIVVGTLTISIISLLCNLTYWITSSQIIATLITVAFCLWNVFKPEFVLNLFCKAKIVEKDFITGNKVILDIMILTLILLSFIFLAFVIIRKKEFLNDTRGGNGV